MVDRPGRMEGKIALITGCASGLGKASAELIVEEGGQVMIADINATAGESLAQSLGAAAAFVHLDVTDEASWIAAINATKAHFGSLHVLVQSAGIAITADVTQTSLEDWRRVHAIDLDGVFLGCKHGVPAIAETIADPGKGSASGSIVDIRRDRRPQHGGLQLSQGRRQTPIQIRRSTLRPSRHGYSVQFPAPHLRRHAYSGRANRQIGP